MSIATAQCRRPLLTLCSEFLHPKRDKAEKERAEKAKDEKEKAEKEKRKAPAAGDGEKETKAPPKKQKVVSDPRVHMLSG
jgi:hypothetical protein